MLEAQKVTVTFPGPTPVVAVAQASLRVAPGETIGLVGESGSGKSTLARALIGLSPVTGGSVRLNGAPIHFRKGLSPDARREVQLVFQDPHASLNPRMTIAEVLTEAVGLITPDRRVARDRVHELVRLVGLEPVHLRRHPHEMSGGQLQRVAIARALAVQPRYLLLDEVTASLDVSVQARILNLLRGLQAELGFAMLYISHDLSVIRYVSDHVYVMRHGVVVEDGPVDQIFTSPRTDYAAELIAAVPTMGGTRWRRTSTHNQENT